ncbi:MAG: thiamine-phosphate synthase family protein [Candidatus Nitrosocosmicus sp.]
MKGGHDSNRNHKILDVLLEKENDNITKLYNDRLEIAETHGTGCNFSSALASFLAKGYGIKVSFFLANDFVKEGLNDIANIGKGIGVTNPMMNLYLNSQRYKVFTSLYNCVKILEEVKDFYLLIPETKTNFVYSLENPKNMQDVAGIVGRITNFGTKIRSPNVVEFGASNHVSRAVISAHQLNHLFRSAINIKNDKKILGVCKANFVCTWYSRNEENPENKGIEGFTVSWGVKNAMEKLHNAEVVFHHGDHGKEPMILIFGKDPLEIIDKVKIIISKLNSN